MGEERAIIDQEVLMEMIYNIAQGLFYLALFSMFMICLGFVWIFYREWRYARIRRRDLEILEQMFEEDSHDQ